MESSLRILVLLGLCALVAAGGLIINEVDYDNVGNDAAEFVELRNMGCTTLSLTGYKLELVRNTNVVYQTITLSGSVASGAYFVICATSSTIAGCNLKVTPAAGCGVSSGPCINLLFNTAGTGVRLKNSGGTTLDQMSYGAVTSGLTEGSSAAPADSNSAQGSVSRCPDGGDTNSNGNDFAFRSTVTAGSPNSCTQAAATVTGCSGATPAPTSAAAGFDFFFMVNQWPGGWNQAFCAEPSWPRGPFWTLHGMWPNYNTGGYPSNCGNEAFQQSQISSIVTDMDRYWPSFKCASDNVTPNGDATFWGYEWGKHGTCSQTVLPSQLSYFSGIINLRKNVIGDMATILSAAGINPGGTYTITSIRNAVSAAIGYLPYVNCNPGTNVMTEIWVCVSNTASLNLIVCPVIPAASCSSTSVQYKTFA
ncbi:Ribonuclease T2 [Klebsormidium nitens]|uniref:Ribonuclease T2 n=1 Tax=Klebsormidium nitens TaxID=105231 RepID=A0A1Y1IM63_KLENI|nr:Ribonuclease T2 [Klebsormidium nitens]|eukprot:GAQ91970.1 Ribonuclease T2 [Klebsormidium nitens]